MGKIYLGTQYKQLVNLDPIAGFTMDDYDFTIEVTCSGSKAIKATKSESIRIDENNYAVRVDTNLLGVGQVMVKVTAYIPDGDFDGGKRTEVLWLDGGNSIQKSLR